MSNPHLIFCTLLASVLASVETQTIPHNRQCYYCGDYNGARQVAVMNPSDCRTFKFCKDNEVCKTTEIPNDQGLLTYEFGCGSLLSCQLVTIINLEIMGITTGVNLQHLQDTGELIGRKRQLHLCDTCCGDALCNNDTCLNIRARLSNFAREGKLNLTTLRIIV